VAADMPAAVTGTTVVPPPAHVTVTVALPSYFALRSEGRYPRVPDSHCVLRWLPAADCARNGGARLIGADASGGTSDTPVSLSTEK
jgi:hypothetical protein